MAQEDIAIMLYNETFQVANNNSALRRLNHFECLASNMVFSPVRLARRDFEKHVVLEDVHVGSVADVALHAFGRVPRKTN